MLQEEYDYAAEMQAEILSRLARLNILHVNVHGAQILSERCRCLTFVTQNILNEKNGIEISIEKLGMLTLQTQNQGIISLCFCYCSLHI